MSMTAEEYHEEEFLQKTGEWFICKDCGERELVSIYDRHYPDDLFCGYCSKELVPEDEITPDLAGILLCKRAGAVSIFKNTQGHVWMYEPEEATNAAV